MHNDTKDVAVFEAAQLPSILKASRANQLIDRAEPAQREQAPDRASQGLPKLHPIAKASVEDDSTRLRTDNPTVGDHQRAGTPSR